MLTVIIFTFNGTQIKADLTDFCCFTQHVDYNTNPEFLSKNFFDCDAASLTRVKLPAIIWAVCLVWLTGCAPVDSLLVKTGLVTPTPTPDPYFHYRAALQPSAQADIEAIGPLPSYHLTVRLDESGQTLHGIAQVSVPQPETELVFRLYPNLDNFGGRAQVAAAQINKMAVEVTPLADGAAMRLAVPPTRDDFVTVDLAFTVQLPGQRGLDEADYTLFGWDGPILSLPGFYPTLAVKQGNEWVLDAPPPHGDALFNEVALYQLNLTLPDDLLPVAGGVTVNVSNNPDQTRTWQITGGPLRDMTVIIGPFQAISESAAGATVTTYYLPGQHDAAGLVLTHAAAAMRLYSDMYGPYPYAELDVVEAPLKLRGMEYSGLLLIGEAAFSGPRDHQAFLTAHEVAHQWWYAVVGNNPYQSPWLDEGLAEYSAFVYLQGVFGRAEAERFLTERWLIPFESALNGGIEGVVDRPAAQFDPEDYDLLVYVKAALFFKAIRQQLGEATFQQVMQAYYAENRYRLVSPPTFLVTAQRVSGQNLNPLAEQWLK